MMSFVRELLVPSVRNRLLILTILLVGVITGTVLVFVSLQIRSLTDARLKQDFSNTYQTFRRFLTLRNERLVESCLLISELPTLKAALSTHDPTTIREFGLSQASPANLAEVDIFTLTDEKGRVLFRLDRPQKFGDVIVDLSGIKTALDGIDPSASDISIWTIDDQLYQTITVPIVQKFVVGTLTLGKRITTEEAQSLKEGTQSDITFLLGNRVIATTHSDVAQADLLRYYLLERAYLDSAIGNGKSIQREVRLNEETFLCAFSKASAGSPAVYVMALSVDQALAAFERIGNVVIISGAVALILAILGAFLLAERITAPLRRLVAGTEAIKAGNYDFQINLDAKDELGSLARSFNEMVSGLRERFLMSKFVSSSTVEMIQQGRGEVQLGGERKNVTVLFSDIRGFTSFSERVEPEVVIELLNNYLSRQASIVIRYHGIIDKYVGDAMVAVFEGEDMVDHAVQCAVEIQKQIGELNKLNSEDIRLGIGINTGMAIVGNVGSNERMDHTVLGSNVNLGQRICTIASAGQIIISESSWRLLKTKAVRTRVLDSVFVKGMSRPMQTYEVLY